MLSRTPKYGDKDYDPYNQYHNHSENPSIRSWHVFGHPLNPKTITLIQWTKISDTEKMDVFFKLQNKIKVIEKHLTEI